MTWILIAIVWALACIALFVGILVPAFEINQINQLGWEDAPGISAFAVWALVTSVGFIYSVERA